MAYQLDGSELFRSCIRCAVISTKFQPRLIAKRFDQAVNANKRKNSQCVRNLSSVPAHLRGKIVSAKAKAGAKSA